MLAHAQAAGRIGGVDQGLERGDVIRVGRTVELECLDTPGHTLAHICLFAHGEEPALFSGDTLFNAGAGNCHSTGRPELLYDTFVTQLARLPDTTRLYPGHEYLARNLEFTLDREPDNEEAAQLLAVAKHTAPEAVPVTTLGQEKRVNTFFRLHNPRIIQGLHRALPGSWGTPGSQDGVPETA